MNYERGNRLNATESMRKLSNLFHQSEGGVKSPVGAPRSEFSVVPTYLRFLPPADELTRKIHCKTMSSVSWETIARLRRPISTNAGGRKWEPHVLCLKWSTRPLRFRARFTAGFWHWPSIRDGIVDLRQSWLTPKRFVLNPDTPRRHFVRFQPLVNKSVHKSVEDAKTSRIADGRLNYLA